MIAESKSGSSVEILEDGVMLRRAHEPHRSSASGKKIPYAAIASVQFRDAGITNGYIQFQTRNARKVSSLTQALADENTVVFTREVANEFDEIRREVEHRLRDRASKSQKRGGVARDRLTRLERLQKLKDSGALTESEYDSEKAKILRQDANIDRKIPWVPLGLVASGILLVALLVGQPDQTRSPSDNSVSPRAVVFAAPAPTKAPIVQADVPQYTPLPVGQTLEWVAQDSYAPVVRQAGPYVLEVTRRDQDDMAAPVLKVSADGQTVTLEGDLASPSFTHRISVITNRAGAVPVIMLQSFSGGAHCCNHVQLAGFSQGKLKVVDLGSWDGDEISLPTDISGDGVADFVMRDDRFLYAFASYAQSYAPPLVFNVVNGKVNDVSRSPKFRQLYVDEMSKAGQACEPGNGADANGACPSFVAAAARAGKLDDAWSQMLSAYDPNVDWTLPAGCLVSDRNGCPAGLQITYKSYPEALQAFLVKAGYIATTWVPPERRNPAPTDILSGGLQTER